MKLMRLLSPIKKLIVIIIVLTLLLLGIDKLYGFIMLKLYPKDYSEFVEKYCAEYSVSEDFAYAFIKCESNFNPNAESKAGAKGLMQLTPETFSYLSKKLTGEAIDESQIFEPELNIRFGIYYISYLSEKFKGDKSLVIAAYNAGPARVEEWLNNKKYSADGKTLKTYPYKETENHIEKIFSAENKYKTLYK